jgi:hypothetical protein
MRITVVGAVLIVAGVVVLVLVVRTLNNQRNRDLQQHKSQ